MSSLFNYETLKIFAAGAWVLIGAYRGHVTYVSSLSSHSDQKYYYLTDMGYAITGAHIYMALGWLMTIFPPATVFIGITELYNLEDCLRGRSIAI